MFSCPPPTSHKKFLRTPLVTTKGKMAVLRKNLRPLGCELALGETLQRDAAAMARRWRHYFTSPKIEPKISRTDNVVLNRNAILPIFAVFFSFLSSCHEKGTEALCIEQIQTRLGVALVSEFLLELCF